MSGEDPILGPAVVVADHYLVLTPCHAEVVRLDMSELEPWMSLAVTLPSPSLPTTAVVRGALAEPAGRQQTAGWRRP